MPVMEVPSTMRAVVIEGDKAVVKTGVQVPGLAGNTALIKVKAVASNPTDWKHIFWQIGPQGSILGCDVAGEIVSLGPEADGRWAIGDKVCAMVHGASVKYPENGAFAEYAKVDLAICLKLKDLEYATADSSGVVPHGKVSTWEAAASIPVCLLTASNVLMNQLGNKLEWEPKNPQHPHSVLVWGGATVTGQFFIQLAKRTNAYANIVVVASKKHESMLKGFGADEIFDYHDEDVLAQITKKYPDLYHILDAVATPSTFGQVYACAPTDKPVTLVELISFSENDIPPAERKSNVSINLTMMYLVSGESIPFGTVTFPADPKVRTSVIEFLEFIQPRIESGEIHHPAVKISKGLDTIPSLMEDIKTGRNSGFKLVASL
ncbi:uncharacterized protein Ecym_6369 [Eremothecium cymbalariae DBVPG|uniref:Enoyl reductase (ER) domain-containing protein n=1 Tax=Eremothecium cymbalariae (strain CBS 270.75 / DBVPG 7215 / KCTC 17166 / NRRL Y-17582) TaxID=931890 RepID=G8JUG4_ERECY|nr:hypothetical protein Ecym_6369 [Eremothecium cymbalariae DBVPG\